MARVRYTPAGMARRGHTVRGRTAVIRTGYGTVELGAGRKKPSHSIYLPTGEVSAANRDALREASYVPGTGLREALHHEFGANINNVVEALRLNPAYADNSNNNVEEHEMGNFQLISSGISKPPAIAGHVVNNPEFRAAVTELVRQAPRPNARAAGHMVAHFPDGRRVPFVLTDGSSHGGRISAIAVAEWSTGTLGPDDAAIAFTIDDKAMEEAGLTASDIVLLQGVAVDVVGTAGTAGGDATQTAVDAFVRRTQMNALLQLSVGGRPTSWDRQTLAEWLDGAERTFADLDGGAGVSGVAIGLRAGSLGVIVAAVKGYGAQLTLPTGATVQFVLRLSFAAPTEVAG